MLSSARKFAKRGLGAWVRRCGVTAAIAALALLPTGASDAGWLSDVFKGKSDKSDKPSKRTAAPRSAAREKTAAPKPRAEKPVATNSSPSGPVATTCDPMKFRIVVDVGHTAKSEGAMSARNVTEFDFNLRLAQRVVEKLQTQGFPETKLLVTQGRARPSLAARVAAAQNLHANLFLSIHHDSVPDKFMEKWEFEGKKSHFSDRFHGYSVFVSRYNPEYKASLAFAELVARELKARGLEYAVQYSQPIMGRYQHPLLNKETGVYSYDELIVLKTSRMPAVLVESGSIINRDEELRMASPEHRETVSSAVVTAAREFCTPPQKGEPQSAQVAR